MEDNLTNGFDNPFIMLLTKVGELMIANFLFILCSLPLVTLGAAASAMTQVVQNVVLDRGNGVIKTFFRAFRENFKQATVLWLWGALILGGLICYRLIIVSFCAGTLAAVLNGVLTVVALLALCIAVYVLPLMVRYDNTLREHLKNAMLLAVIKLPRTVVLVLIALIMPAIFYVSIPVFIQTLFFWMMIGFSFCSYLSHLLLKPVFQELEASADGSSVGILN